ncbi:uncharacterized protein LOC105355772 isoform X3 [Oryzias latipes]
MCVSACFRSWPVISRALRTQEEVVVDDDSVFFEGFLMKRRMKGDPLDPLVPTTSRCNSAPPSCLQGREQAISGRTFASTTPSQVTSATLVPIATHDALQNQWLSLP